MVVEQRAINGQFLPGNRDGFQPEQSGNPAGRPKNSVTTLLKNTDKETTKKIAKKLTELAEDGDLKAIDMFIDRTDGKVAGDALVQDNRVVNIFLSEKGAKARKRIAEVTKK